jgi:hypothetical protein
MFLFLHQRVVDNRVDRHDLIQIMKKGTSGSCGAAPQ